MQTYVPRFMINNRFALSETRRISIPIRFGYRSNFPRDYNSAHGRNP